MLPDKADTDDKGGENSNMNEVNSDKSEKNSDKGGKNSFDKDTVDQDARQKQEKGSASEGTVAHSFSVGKILLLVLVPVLLITAGVIFLLVRRKKAGKP